MGWPKLLVLVRHAESEGNTKTVEERTAFEVSTHAYDLTPRGREQARITGEYLRRTYGDFDTYYSSYYKRAKETLRIMYPEPRHFEDSRLAEGQRGIWHIMTTDEVAKIFPKEAARKNREGLYHHRPLGGENWADIELRIHSFLGTLARDGDGQKVLVVVHGHWLILFQRLIHHFCIDEAERRYRGGVFGNASVTVYNGIERDGKPRLVLEKENILPWEGKI
ncbi:MAG: hypothetical protein A2754_03860 [Candidatus Magasanikbacteria bacterium RIFCSPHIGHO2_01_FULL_47_8]|uniref:phosphoglycerate mutase (2,3-diphosphoglycerate-dependent) n=1 Tax=Candidatus Magasanikbacteria bacterium RIFCSPHIGHO2_01_FULL_47_8 TaxID=1798673 RepID=A0A1F6MCX7_9BACT|nr:MAG: hypothetical protein A2754_03860 [Candidatus Magasanikbacteria bacterium RIFCSPHIGHO2_01_FULL_47_8]